ncbi:V-type proton ATPase subunit C [Camellia lanceoleosa]|uniref:V-type proton ATPase subunit C n=1 Tax=Camellia lanceoleosa TaxID=1840588 RepID=A0ACC0FEK4_9ERIC|nr:V-type proton ATPase subunit C [Camellia lanceoleosa]
MATRYWVVSLPVQNSASSLWTRLQQSISKRAFDTPIYRFNIPNLRVGTLDSLLALSDDLLKSNSFIEGVSHKIRRQIEELERVSGVVSSSLTVDGVPVDSYLTRFVWDEAKYPTMSPLKEIVDGIHVQAAKIEDELKEYALYTVTLFSRDADNFRTKARDRGFQIRDFEYNPETQESRKQELEKLMQDQETLRNSLCNGAMQLWGVAPAPSVKSEKKVRSILEELCDSANSTYWKSEDGGMGGLGGDADAYPYVSFTINLV